MEGYLESVDHLSARQYQLAVRKLADALSYGTDRSPFLGSGIEYAQSRPYQPGDSVRSIDWRITARCGRVFVKEYEAPKQMPCYLLLDTSASMTVSSVAKSKYAVATHVAGAVAFACLDRVSPVGVIGAGETETRIEPKVSTPPTELNCASRQTTNQTAKRTESFQTAKRTKLRTGPTAN